MALENQLRVGDVLFGFRFPVAAPSGGAPGFSNSGVVDVTCQVRRMTKRVKRVIFFKKVEMVEETLTCDFRWLPWASGKVNFCQHQGKDVLSGNFTGCWMAAYTDGSARVSHIATQTDETDCKAFWNNSKAGFGAVQEFCPHLLTPGDPYSYGLVTATGELYAIGLTDEKNVTIPNPWRTAQEWKDNLGMEDDVAEIMCKYEAVDAKTIYNCPSFRITRIVKATAGAFPTTDG